MPTSRRHGRHGRGVLARGVRTAALAVGLVLALLAAPAGPGSGWVRAGGGGTAADTPAAAAASGGGSPGGADGGGAIDPRVPPSLAAPTASPPSVEAADVTPPGAVRDAAAPRAVVAPEGWLVAGGRSPVAGASGPLVAYTVEVEVAAERRVSVDGFAAAVTATLGDAEGGWTSDGRWRLQRIDDPAAARIRVLLAEPARVDELCARAGLDTRGRFSCWNGTFAALNVERWSDGVPHVDDLGLYRTYLVNHEVGHGLGYGHEPCPSPGALAPIMMQLTVATEGCRPNGVPYP